MSYKLASSLPVATGSFTFLFFKTFIMKSREKKQVKSRICFVEFYLLKVAYKSKNSNYITWLFFSGFCVQCTNTL